MPNRYSYIPYYVDRDLRGKVQHPLKSDALPEYLREANFDTSQEYESVFVPASNLVAYPRVVDSQTCLPVYLDALIPVNKYTRLMGGGIKFHASYSGKIVYLYRPKLTYGLGESDRDTIITRSDDLNALYLRSGQSIQQACPAFKVFRITLPFENAPDKVSQKEYNDYTYWWVIMQYNGFIYPEHCSLDRVIKIPDLGQVKSWLKIIQPTTANPIQYKGGRVRI